MSIPRNYDAIVIGAGQGGGPLSSALARSGRKTALIERADVGGTCINIGCTPTKTMVASARVAYLAGRAADYGVHTGQVTVDMVRVRQRKREIVERFRAGSQRHIEETPNLDLIFGEASFTGPKTIDVRLRMDGSHSTLVGDTIVIDVGIRPARSNVAGLDGLAVLDSTSIMELDMVPEHLVVLGGGYVGLEFSQMFRRFGSRVTIIQRGPRLLTREDVDVADEVARVLREDGLTLLLETEAVRAEQGANGQIHLTVRAPSGEQVLTGSHVLEATGRIPNTDSLQLAAAGVATDERGFIVVNERLETNVAGIFAIGDVKGGAAFTHISYDDFRILRANILEGGSATTRDRLVPYTVFIDPQLGRIGLSEEEARVQGRAFRIARLPMSHVARALEVDEARGFMKVILDAETNQILGCAVLGIEGGEVMALLQMAMLGRIPYPTLRDAVFAHPTLAESLNNLFADPGPVIEPGNVVAESAS